MQTRPDFNPEGHTFGESKVTSKAKPITQLWHQNGRCPEGTIPIRRTTSNDILRASSVQHFGKKKHKSFPQPRSAKPQPDIITQSGHQVPLLFLPVLPLHTHNAKSFKLVISTRQKREKKTLCMHMKALYYCSFIVFFSIWSNQHAIVYVEGDKFYGAKATINVWDPKIQQPNEFSLSQMWILGGSFGQDLNSIEAGWQV